MHCYDQAGRSAGYARGWGGQCVCAALLLLPGTQGRMKEIVGLLEGDFTITVTDGKTGSPLQPLVAVGPARETVTLPCQP